MKTKKILEESEDPFLIDAGTEPGNLYRTKRAIVRLESIDMDNMAIIKQLKSENQKLKKELQKLKEKANEVDRIEEKFIQVSSIILENRVSKNDKSDL